MEFKKKIKKIGKERGRGGKEREKREKLIPEKNVQGEIKIPIGNIASSP